MDEQNWKSVLMFPEATIKQAISNLNESGLRIIIAILPEGTLLGSITDGDIRRGLLRGLTLDTPILSIINKNPLVVSNQMSRDMVLHLMEINKIYQIPIINKEKKVVGLHLWDKLSELKERLNTVVIMAGGLGTRLRPYTESCPKPMLPVGGKPLLEHIIERAKKEGFRHFVLAVRYLGHMIEEYFGDGSEWNVDIQYLKEQEPLGTAGALSLLKTPSNLPIIVSNSDVLTDISYRELLDFHTEHKAMATMAVRMHEIQHPFGVVQVNGFNIIGFEEKPTYRTHINAGIYAINPNGLHHIKKNEHCNMPHFFEKLISIGEHAIVYPMHEPWIDIGRHGDYEKANNIFNIEKNIETIKL